MKDGLAGSVRALAEELGPELREIRRRIHRHPELGFQEIETAKLVAQRLKKLGIEVQEKVAQTGVVGLLRGQSPGKTLGLRADMDALPLQEQSACPYCSQRSGAMHACGHDAHVACLLGAAEILARLEVEIPGTVKLLFQPSEEDVPSGAIAMIEAGVLDRPAVDAMVALHVAPEIPSGAIGVRAGPLLAEARDFEIKIRGRAGHGAHPHQSIDAIVVAAHFVAELQSIVSRRVDPLKPAVVSVGEIQGGCADNIIADLVELKGTVRGLESQLSDGLVKAVEEILQGVTMAAGAKGQIRWTQGCQVLVNDRDLTEAVRRAATQICGPEGLYADVPQSMGGDDLAYFLQRVPGALFLLGTNDGTERTAYPLHHPRFDIDEKALTTGAAVLAQVALNFLSND
jgi:amidohydrolase